MLSENKMSLLVVVTPKPSPRSPAVPQHLYFLHTLMLIQRYILFSFHHLWFPNPWLHSAITLAIWPAITHASSRWNRTRKDSAKWRGVREMGRARDGELEYGSASVYRWILPPAKQHISDSAVKGDLIWASEPRMSLVSIPGMFSITLPLLSCFVADPSITARSNHVSRWLEPLLKQTGLIVVPDTSGEAKHHLTHSVPNRLLSPRPRSWITGHITSLFHNLVFDVNNSTCEATAIEAHCKWSEISSPAITIASNPLWRIKEIALLLSHMPFLLVPGTETLPIQLI